MALALAVLAGALPRDPTYAAGTVSALAADTTAVGSLPVDRLVYIERTIVTATPPGGFGCGAAYTTSLVVADSVGGGHKQILYGNQSPCYGMGGVRLNPQRTEIAFTIGGVLLVLDVAAALAGNAVPRVFTERYYCDAPAWNSDGSRILCRGGGNLLIVDPAQMHLLASISPESYGIGMQTADWLANGDILLSGYSMARTCTFSWGQSALNNVWRLYLADTVVTSVAPVLPTDCNAPSANGTANVQVAPAGDQFAYLAWGGAGTAGSSLRVADVNGTNDRLLAAATADTSYGYFSWSPDGRYLVSEVYEQVNNLFGLVSNIDFIDVQTGRPLIAILAAGDTDALNPAAAQPSDITAPTVTGMPDRSANPAGWYNAPVTVTWSATDPPPSSGTPTTPRPTTIAGEGANQVATSAPSCDPAGNCATGSYGPVNIDLTPPTIASVLSPAPNAAGWVNHPVTVSFACTDALSGVASCPTPVTAGTDGAGQVVTGVAVDNAGNTATGTATVNVDTTPPSITASLSQAANGAGWNNADVTVTFTCSDALSGVALCPTPVTLTQDGADQVVSGTATDAGGNSTTTTVTVSIDKTAPLITAVRTAGNSSGWNNTDVTVTYTCADALSGLAICPGPTVLGTEGPDQSTTAVAVDRAGNAATATVAGINIDKTPPAITATVIGTHTSAGWYRTAPTIHYTCTDSLSGIATCPADLTLTTDGANQSVTGTAVDAAGNTATTTVSGINVDTTAPLVSIAGAVNGATYPLPQSPTPSCVTSDTTSGVATQATLTSSRNPSGVYTVTCTGATDAAGNTTPPVAITYTVTPTAASLTVLTNQYVSSSGSPDTNGVINDLDNKLAHNQTCLYINKVQTQPTAPNPTLTQIQADELVYWARILAATC